MEDRVRLFRVLLWSSGLILLFVLYTSGLSQNPPGFHMDQSASAYHAYLVAHTGAGEFGPRFPLFSFKPIPLGWMQKKITSLRPTLPDKLEGASSLALLKSSLYV